MAIWKGMFESNQLGLSSDYYNDNPFNVSNLYMYARDYLYKWY